MLFSHLRPSSGECGDCRATIPVQSGLAKAAGLLPLFGECTPDNARPSLGVALREQHRLGQFPAHESGGLSSSDVLRGRLPIPCLPFRASLAWRFQHGTHDEGTCLSS